MKDGLLRVEEVALILNCSVNTINAWYRFRSQEPDNEYAKMLPDYIKAGGQTTVRLWKQSDIPKLLEFQHKRPIGRNGVMGKVTQKYVNKKEDKK